MLGDLERVRRWAQAAPDRRVELDGISGARGVTLHEGKLAARYAFVASAAMALAAGHVRWRPVVECEAPEGKGTPAAKRKMGKRKARGGTRGKARSAAAREKLTSRNR